MTAWIMPLACVFVLGACGSMNSGSSSGVSSGSSSGTGSAGSSTRIYDNAGAAGSGGPGLPNSADQTGGSANVGSPPAQAK